MSRRCRAVFLLLVLATVGCTAPSAPSYISAEFVLADVDGHPLPTGSPPSVGRPGPSIVSGSMALDQGGGAYISENRMDSNGTPYTVQNVYNYGIKYTHIKFEIPCPPGIICPAGPTGEILDNGLRVQVVFPPNYPFTIYNFRTVPRT